MVNKEKILVVRVGRVGDLVMITPAIDALLKAFPDTEIHILTSREGQRVLGGYDRRLTEMPIYRRRFPHNIRFRISDLGNLRNQVYSRIYIFETNAHYHRLLEGVSNAVYHLVDNDNEKHFSQRCLDLVASSTDALPEKNWIRLPVSDSGLTEARALLAKSGIREGDFIVGMHPTFSGSHRGTRDSKGTKHRVWPQESFAQLAQLLDERSREDGHRVRVVIDTLPEERTLVESIVRESGGVITLLSEPPNFERYKGLLSCFDVMVTANTGPMHIAAAVGTRVVALFSGWSAEECGPFVAEDRYRVIRAEDTDRPELGLAAIPAEAVADLVLELQD